MLTGFKGKYAYINDPANGAVRADAGIAMGGIGSDIAIEYADAVLVSDEIKRLPYLFDMMQRVMKKIKVNIIASLVINLSAVILSAFEVPIAALPLNEKLRYV